MAQIRTSTVQQRREEVCAALRYAAGFHWRSGTILKKTRAQSFVDTKNDKKHCTKWCAATSKYRCMRCGRSCNNTKTPGKRDGPMWMGKEFKLQFEKMENGARGRARHGKKCRL